MSAKGLIAEHVCDISATLLLLTVLLFNPDTLLSAGAEGTNDSSAIFRLVAQQDFKVNPALKPPEIMGRRFWNVMDRKSRNKSDAKPLPTKIPHTPNEKIARSAEPMVREAALWYSIKNLLVPDTNNYLAISAARLPEMEFDSRVPFILVGGCLNHFKCMVDFQVDHKEYNRWKKEHPNFLGFLAGAEYDNNYVGLLTQPDMDKTAKRLREVFLCSETAVARATNIFMNAVKGRDQALAGSYAAYQVARRYYFNYPDKMIFLHSAWCWDHYPLEWGAGMMILETTNTGPYRHQVSMSFTRGAARQYGRPWAWYIAPGYNGCTEDGKFISDAFPYCLTTNTAVCSVGNGGPTCGMSVSLYRRDMYLAYLSGASFVKHETWPYAYWQFKNQDVRAEPELSPYGEAMKEWYAFTQWFPDRGVSYAPVALMIPFNQGYPQWGGPPWSFFPVERPDTMIDAFTYTLVSSSRDLKKGTEGCLANSPYGDIYDVILPNPPSGPVALKALMNYKAAVMLGGFYPDKALAKRLMEYVKKGGTLVINIRQVNDNLPEDFIGVKRTGTICGTEGIIKVTGGQDSVTLSEPYDYEKIELKGAEPLWVDSRGGILASGNEYGRGWVVLTAVDYMVPRKELSSWTKKENIDQYMKDMNSMKASLVKLLMRQIVKDVLPVEVQGDIEYGLNKVSDGWWVYLINNKGVTKFALTPEKLDPAAANVTINMRSLMPTKVQELRNGDELAWDRGKNSLAITVGPGDIKVVKIEVKGTDNIKK